MPLLLVLAVVVLGLLFAGLLFVVSRSSSNSSNALETTVEFPTRFASGSLVNAWRVEVTYPRGLPDGAPIASAEVYDLPTIGGVNQIEVTFTAQEPPYLASETKKFGKRSENNNIVRGGAGQLPVCNGCTKTYLLTARLTAPPSPPITQEAGLHLTMELTQAISGTSGGLQIKITPLETEPKGDVVTSEPARAITASVDEPAVRYVSARTTGDAASIRVTSSSDLVDTSVLLAFAEPVAGEASRSRPSGATTGTAAGNNTREGRIRAVPSGAWLPASESCSQQCQVGLFVVGVPDASGYGRPGDPQIVDWQVEGVGIDPNSIRVFEPTDAAAEVSAAPGSKLSGTWRLTRPAAPAVTLTLTGGRGEAEGTVGGLKITYGYGSGVLLESPGCWTDCPPELPYDLTVRTATTTTWVRLYAVDPAQPDKAISDTDLRADKT